MTVKSVVQVREADWRRFRALAAERGQTVQALLGRLVERELRAADRQREKALGRSKAVKQAYERTLAELEGDR